MKHTLLIKGWFWLLYLSYFPVVVLFVVDR